MKLRFCPAIAAIVFLSVPAVAHAQQWTSGSGGTIYYNGGNVGIGKTAPNSIGDGGSPTILQVRGANGALPFGVLQLTTNAAAPAGQEKQGAKEVENRNDQ